MSNINEIYTDRVLHQRLYRDKEKSQYQQTIDNDWDSTISESDVNDFDLSDDESTISPLNQFHNDKYAKDNYLQDRDDDINTANDNLFDHDHSPPLYEQSTITTNEAVGRLMEFCINSNFDKQKIIKMMCLVKSILPSSNKLPTIFRQILNIYDKTPSSNQKFSCNNCWILTTKPGGQ
jgi:hypothetical protein